jgi:hypothetical protein
MMTKCKSLKMRGEDMQVYEHPLFQEVADVT